LPCTCLAQATKKLGLIWKNIGNAEPSSGTEINDTKLAMALAGKTKITKLDNLNVSNSSYIKLGDDYFQPQLPALSSELIMICKMSVQLP